MGGGHIPFMAWLQGSWYGSRGVQSQGRWGGTQQEAGEGARHQPGTQPLHWAGRSGGKKVIGPGVEDTVLGESAAHKPRHLGKENDMIDLGIWTAVLKRDNAAEGQAPQRPTQLRAPCKDSPCKLNICARTHTHVCTVNILYN